MRIDIMGQAGSGKSTLAEAISKKLSIPHIQIDRFWIEAGGRQGSHDTPNIDKVREHVRKNVLEHIAADSWVSDGFYSRVQPDIATRADVIIFLDIPLWKRLLNQMRRALFKRSTRGKDFGVWQELTFFFEIIRRHKRYDRKIRAFVGEYKNKMIVFTSYKEVNAFLADLR